jgi:hypothetical protein
MNESNQNISNKFLKSNKEVNGNNKNAKNT